MPWSDHQSYVYVAIPKTGSTSTVATLKKLHRKHGGKLLLQTEKVDRAFRNKYGLNSIGDKQPGKAKHLSALQLKYILGKRYDRCFRFTMVRNPWARTVSRYHFHHVDFMPSEEEKIRRGTSRKFHNLNFEEWVEKRWKRWRTKKSRYRTQLSKIVDKDGQILVDYIGRLETFQDSFNHICDQLRLPHIETEYRNWTKKEHYSELYNNRIRDMVHEMCAEDIDYFNYEFEQR